MEKRIKYLNYKVYRDGELIHAGTVPSILALSGAEKSFNLGGVWLWYTCPGLTMLALSDGTNTVNHYSDRKGEQWLNYCEVTLGKKITRW